jgi:PAS domain-containing protein
MLSVGVGLCGQIVFMSRSATLFDYQFDVAHLLKIASYICMLVGLLISFYATFRQTNELGQRLSAFVNNTVDGIITVNHYGTIETVNPAVVGMFGYPADELLYAGAVKAVAIAPTVAEDISNPREKRCSMVLSFR